MPEDFTAAPEKKETRWGLARLSAPRGASQSGHRVLRSFRSVLPAFLHPFAVCRGRPIQLSAVALVNSPELAHSEPEHPWDYCAASEVAPTELRWRLMSAGRECRTLWSAAAARIRCQGSGGRRKVTPRSADETSPLHPWRGNWPLLLPSLLPYDG
jgi:hypothetical protein